MTNDGGDNSLFGASSELPPIARPLALSLPTGDKPYLGDPAAVDALLRDLVLSLSNHRDAVLAGHMNHEQMLAAVTEDRRKRVDLFLGRTDDVQPVQGWNTDSTEPGTLQSYLAQRGHDPDPALALSGLLGGVQSRALRAMNESDAGRIDDDTFQFWMEVNTEDAVGELIGVPNLAD